MARISECVDYDLERSFLDVVEAAPGSAEWLTAADFADHGNAKRWNELRRRPPPLAFSVADMHVEKLARKLRELRRRRDVALALEGLRREVLEGRVGLDDPLFGLGDRLLELAHAFPPSDSDAGSGKPVIKQVFEKLEVAFETDASERHLPSCDAVSRTLLRLAEPGRIVLVAGQPGAPSVLAAAGAVAEAIEQSIPLRLIGVAGSGRDLYRRAFARRARIPYARLLAGWLDDEHWPGIARSAEAAFKNDTWIAESVSLAGFREVEMAGALLVARLSDFDDAALASLREAAETGAGVVAFADLPSPEDRPISTALLRLGTPGLRGTDAACVFSGGGPADALVLTLEDGSRRTVHPSTRWAQQPEIFPGNDEEADVDV